MFPGPDYHRLKRINRACAFFDYLQSPAARAVFVKHGFVVFDKK